MKTTTAKQTVTGTIISARDQHSAYGPSYKMRVQCGGFRVWSTIPQALFDACEASGMVNTRGWMTHLRGCQVSFSATLEAGRDTGFFFAKRPTKAQLLSTGTNAMREPEVEGPLTEAGEFPILIAA